MNSFYKSWKDVPAAEWSKRWPNFSPEEIASNVFLADGKTKVKGPILINERALDMLQALREKLGKPFIINSAYRDPEYNRKIGGAKSSQHMQGMAFDISMANHNPTEFEAAAIKIGFKGIGHYPASNFMHIDARQAPQAVRWQGTGANAKWFPKSTQTTFSGDEPKPQTVLDIIRKPEVLAPVGVAAGTVVTAVTPLTQGDGPFQWALAAGFFFIVIAAGIFLFKKFGRSSREI